MPVICVICVNVLLSQVLREDPGLVGLYRHDHSGRIHAWSAGTRDIPAGWHCSWCFNAQGVRYKMLAAHVSDTPRWGSFKNFTGASHWSYGLFTFTRFEPVLSKRAVFCITLCKWKRIISSQLARLMVRLIRSVKRSKRRAKIW